MKEKFKPLKEEKIPPQWKIQEGENTNLEEAVETVKQ
jgi:hypothetical protein